MDIMQVYFGRYNSIHVMGKLGDFHRLFAGLLALVSVRPAGTATDRPAISTPVGFLGFPLCSSKR